MLKAWKDTWGHALPALGQGDTGIPNITEERVGVKGWGSSESSKEPWAGAKTLIIPTSLSLAPDSFLNLRPSDPMVS